MKAKTTNNLGIWLQSARQRLAAAFLLTDTSTLEIQVIAAYVLARPRTWVLAHPEYSLTQPQQETLDDLLGRFIAGIPLPYLTGEQEFYGLKFIVSPAVLIPRPETELLVERALFWLNTHPGARRAADVGVGSGCISVTLTKHTPNLQLLAVDRSRPALLVARQNAAMHQVSPQITFLQTDLLNSINSTIDLVCANLPYIPTPELTGLAVAQFEPQMALDGGMDGLDLIRALLHDAPRWLSPAGCLLLEIEYRQGPTVAALAQAAFPTASVKVIQDLSGLDRLVEITH